MVQGCERQHPGLKGWQAVGFQAAAALPAGHLWLNLCVSQQQALGVPKRVSIFLSGARLLVSSTPLLS